MISKKAILRGLIGIPIGVFISATISLIYCLAYGEIMVIPPNATMIDPLKYYVIQYFVSIIIGFTFGAGSTIFEIDNLSIAKQTFIHFLITTMVFFPCSILARWVKPDVISITIYITIFICIYVSIWLTQYFRYNKKVQELNKKLKDK